MKKGNVRCVVVLATLIGAAAAASAAYATTRSADGGPSEGVALAPQAPARDAAPLQIPIDSKMQRLVFAASGAQLIRTVVTSANDPPGQLYGAGFEYWSGNGALVVAGLTSLTMTATEGQFSEAQIDDFLLPSQSWGPVLDVIQNIGKAGWTRGTYHPRAAKRRLFKAVDPDDSSRFIGLLIEQGSSNALERITWYKAAPTKTIFAETPPSLTFTVVTTSGGQQASTNPSDIDPQATWYYASAP